MYTNSLFYLLIYCGCNSNSKSNQLFKLTFVKKDLPTSENHKNCEIVNTEDINRYKILGDY